MQASSPRVQRIENEWLLLQSLISANPHILQDARRGLDVFEITILDTTSPIMTENGLELHARHSVRLVFPKFFPTMPSEAYVLRPVFHPNVHPQSGFVCLWSEWSVQRSVIDTLGQLQAVLTYRRWNDSDDHVMQSEALNWTQQPGFDSMLQCSVLARPEGWVTADKPRSSTARHRLS